MRTEEGRRVKGGRQREESGRRMREEDEKGRHIEEGRVEGGTIATYTTINSSSFDRLELSWLQLL